MPEREQVSSGVPAAVPPCSCQHPSSTQEFMIVLAGAAQYVVGKWEF